MVIDDKGGEIVYKDSEKTTKGERNKDISDRERYNKGMGSIKIYPVVSLVIPLEIHPETHKPLGYHKVWWFG